MLDFEGKLRYNKIHKALYLGRNVKYTKMEKLEDKSNIKEVIEWILCIIIAVILALVVRHYVFTPTAVRQVSMKPTLIENDRLFLNRWSITRKEELKRGDIITFEAPSDTDIKVGQISMDNPVAIYNNNPNSIFSKFVYYVLEIGKESYIKRVIGVAGDHILIEDR